MTSARLHTDQHHSDATPTESLVSTNETRRYVVTQGGRVVPIDDKDIATVHETPQTFAAKLRAVGYREPSGIQLSSNEAQEMAMARCSVKNCGQSVIPPATMCDDCDNETEAMSRYLRAREIYLREMARRPSLWERLGVMIANIWHKCWGGIVLIVATSFLTIGLCAADIPDWCLKGIAKVETNTEWRDIGDLTYRDRREGADGETGPWQLSPAALKDLGVSHLRTRIHREPILAESITRAWLLRCYARTGNWFEAVSIYHTGPRGDRRRGIKYAERVLAAGCNIN